MRNPAAAGFYPSENLEPAVKQYLVSQKSMNALGVVIPHAGYAFSGSVAGTTLKTASTGKKNFVLFGPNHTGYGPDIAMSSEDWKTPLGIVKNNRKLISELKDTIKIDEDAHRYEHSLEVQLPFLQVLYKNFTITPVCMQHLGLGRLEELSKLFSSDSFYIASSDFIHFGPMYNYVPVDGSIEDQLEWVKNTDEELAKKICSLDVEGFYNSVIDNGYSVCGFVPITLLMLVMKRIGAKRGELISYKTSYDVRPDSSFVSYAGIAFI